MSYLDILVLEVLLDAPRHGYEIKRQVERILGGTVLLNSNVLYPALREFEQIGALSKTVEPQDGRPARHVYRLTPVGEETLYAMLREFPPESARSQFEFLTRLAFFDLLEPEAQTEILEAREAALSSFLEHLRLMEEKTKQTKQVGAPRREWNLRAVELEILQLEQEREWIRRLKESQPGGSGNAPEGKRTKGSGRYP